MADEVIEASEVISTQVYTVSAQLERRGSIFQNGFLGEVLFEFNIPGVLIKKGLYWLKLLKKVDIVNCLLFGIPTLYIHMNNLEFTNFNFDF